MKTITLQLDLMTLATIQMALQHQATAAQDASAEISRQVAALTQVMSDASAAETAEAGP